MGDVEEIVRKLSKAQRAAIEDTVETLFGDERIIRLRRRSETRVALNLAAKAICEDAGVNRYRLTPLGLAVRQHLLSSKEGE